MYILLNGCLNSFCINEEVTSIVVLHVSLCFIDVLSFIKLNVNVHYLFLATQRWDSWLFVYCEYI